MTGMHRTECRIIVLRVSKVTINILHFNVNLAVCSIYNFFWLFSKNIPTKMLFDDELLTSNLISVLGVT